MGKNIWDVFAPVYEFSMRSQKKIYDFLYARIAEVVKGKEFTWMPTARVFSLAMPIARVVAFTVTTLPAARSPRK